MNMSRLLSRAVLTIFVVTIPAYAQQLNRVQMDTNPRTTPAYSLLVQRKVKVQAELETLLAEYSSDWPPAKRLQFELDTLKVEMKKLAETDEAQIPKLTNGYGTLLLRRAALESEIESLSQEQGSDWPDVKQKRRELELLDNELKEILK
jgi:uncharacterized protein involved in exopolysaccharide biosynthesis